MSQPAAGSHDSGCDRNRSSKRSRSERSSQEADSSGCFRAETASPEDLRTELSYLQQRNDNLQGRMAQQRDLNGKYLALKKDYDDLKKDYDKLQMTHEGLQASYKKATDTFGNVNKGMGEQIDALKREVAQLKVNAARHEEDHAELRRQHRVAYGRLEDDYCDLLASRNRLVREVRVLSGAAATPTGLAVRPYSTLLPPGAENEEYIEDDDVPGELPLTEEQRALKREKERRAEAKAKHKFLEACEAARRREEAMVCCQCQRTPFEMVVPIKRLLQRLEDLAPSKAAELDRRLDCHAAMVELCLTCGAEPPSGLPQRDERSGRCS